MLYRIVVQPGRTLRSGRRGRWFESSQSDHQTKTAFRAAFLFDNCVSNGHEPANAGLTTSERRAEERRSAVKPMSAVNVA